MEQVESTKWSITTKQMGKTGVENSNNNNNMNMGSVTKVYWNWSL